jgi:diaminopimelate epimerase
MTAFHKMHGLGNDFVLFDGRNAALSLSNAQVRALADRWRGIGCDQLIVIEKSPRHDAFMRIYNSDGGETELSGNGVRCMARLLFDESGKSALVIDSKAGLLHCRNAGNGNVTVDMGAPQLDWREIPMAQAVDTENFEISVAGFAEPALKSASAVSMGNPHIVLFVSDAGAAPVERLGTALEHHPWFPARTNVQFVERKNDARLRQRVWERGAGLTQSSGTGACAGAVAAQRRGLCGPEVEIEMDGGIISIAWKGGESHVFMTGPTTYSFTGNIDFEALTKP